MAGSSLTDRIQQFFGPSSRDDRYSSSSRLADNYSANNIQPFSRTLNTMRGDQADINTSARAQAQINPDDDVSYRIYGNRPDEEKVSLGTGNISLSTESNIEKTEKNILTSLETAKRAVQSIGPNKEQLEKALQGIWSGAPSVLSGITSGPVKPQESARDAFSFVAQVEAMFGISLDMTKPITEYALSIHEGSSFASSPDTFDPTDIIQSSALRTTEIDGGIGTGIVNALSGAKLFQVPYGAAPKIAGVESWLAGEFAYASQIYESAGLKDVIEKQAAAFFLSAENFVSRAETQVAINNRLQQGPVQEALNGVKFDVGNVELARLGGQQQGQPGRPG